MSIKQIAKTIAAFLLPAAVIAAAPFAVLAKVDLAVPDAIIGDDTIWGWVSDGTDDILSGIEAEQFQNAKYLVLEIGEIPTEDTWYGLAWLSNNGWSWRENNDFSLKDCLIGDSILCFAFAELIPDYTEFRFEEADYLKVYFRYGDEKDPGNAIFPSSLKITAAYLTNELPVAVGGEEDGGGEDTGTDDDNADDTDSAAVESSPAGSGASSPVPQKNDDGGTNWILWVGIGIGAVGVIVIVIALVTKKK